MSIFKKIKELLTPKPYVPVDISAFMPAIELLAKPTVLLSDAESPGFNKLGGSPNLPDSIEWPVWEDKPLLFLGQFDLATLPSESLEYPMPDEGYLYFFYHAYAWDTSSSNRNADAFQVIFAPVSESEIPVRELPLYTKKKKTKTFVERHVDLRSGLSYPELSDPRIDELGFDEDHWDAYCHFGQNSVGGAPLHQIFGHVWQVQESNMPLTCHVVSNGLYKGKSANYKELLSHENDPEVKDWVLLFQIDSDDRYDMMWGDLGKLYFWIRKQDLAEARFDKCWMLFDCH